MGNTLAHSWYEDASERLTIWELVSALEKAFEKKDGYFPTHMEVDEALRVFLLHMQAIQPSYAHILQGTLRDYHVILNNSAAPEKKRLTGLQGYISYVKERVIAPLKGSPKTRIRSAIADIKQIHLQNLNTNIVANKDVLRALEKVQEDVTRLLSQADKLDDIHELKGQLHHIQDIIQATLASLRNAEALYLKLTHK